MCVETQLQYRIEIEMVERVQRTIDASVLCANDFNFAAVVLSQHAETCVQRCDDTNNNNSAFIFYSEFRKKK